jgi:uncharacterized glyoxalase superfamily protein PhnB
MEFYDGASYRINIEGMDSTLIVDSFRGIIKANIVDVDDYIIVDYENKTFHGNFVGNVIDDLGNVVLNISEKTFYGNVTGNVLDEAGNIVIDNSQQIFYGNVLGNIVDDIGNLVVDKNEKLFHGNVVGNLVDEFGNIIVDKNQRIFFGNVVDENGTMVLDSENKIFIGNFLGNIVDHAGDIVYDSNSNSLWLDDLEVNNLIHGNVKGNVYNANGNLMYDSFTNSAELNELVVKKINAEDIVVTDSIVGEFVGTFAGNVYNSLGEVILDTDIQIIKANLLSETNGISYDYQTNTFYGNFFGNVVSDIQRFNNFQVGDKDIGSSGTALFVSDKDINDDYGPLTISVSKDGNLPGTLALIKTRGSISNPEPVQPGDGIQSIIFGAQSGTNYSISCVPVALIETSVSSNAIVSPGKVPGHFSIKVSNNAGELTEALSINSDGHLKSVIKDVTVVGETSKSPANTSNPDSWLEVNVNGITKFIPLYS